MKTEIPINYDIEYPVLLRKYHELCNESSRQRDAALKLADGWASTFGFLRDNQWQTSADMTAKVCADELRAIFDPKEGK